MSRTVRRKNQRHEYVWVLKDWDLFLKGGPSIHLFDNSLHIYLEKIIIQNKEDKLYHLLTNTNSFYINEIKIYDYNKTIDLLLEK